MELFVCSSLQKAKSLSEIGSLYFPWPPLVGRQQSALSSENAGLISHRSEVQMNQTFAEKVELVSRAHGTDGGVMIGGAGKEQDKIW